MEASSKRGEKKKKKKNKKKIPNVWFSLKKSLDCKSELSDVHDPRFKKELATITTKRPTSSYSSGCSRSIANLKDVIHGSKRHFEKPPNCSPRSIGSNEFLNPITHEVILSNSTCELKITNMSSPSGATERVGTLRPGTPVNYMNQSSSGAKKAFSVLLEREREGLGLLPSRRVSLDRDSTIKGRNSSVSCHKCGELFSKLEAAEAHHLTKHAVTELVEGDSSRKIVEIICRTSWLKSENQFGRIDRILKVHNMQKTLARFEEYRETVKIKASKLPKKHSRCIADGNELLRFHGTTVSCVLGINGSTSLCSSENCCVCRIIRNGFSAKREMNNGIGVFTTSTSGRAFDSIAIAGDKGSGDRKALIVCRVIAGRVHRPVENIEGIGGLNGFDSLAGKVGLHANVEELYLLNPRALLPCFVIICKP